ncbi:MAG: TRAP transporter large permease [Rhodobacterales bacterium]|jgi:C4-dicarboxylate transporter, DctM subunit|nr:TRAP transporter large permease [Pseudomonadota bacterium]MDA1286773.1 TRAP transporter large permease [Pseudomonadota bacterium]NQW13827.1 TRAP transporter large permease [Rhodobacter sp.]
MLESAIGFAIVLALIFLRMPIALAMGVVGFIGYANITNFKASLSLAGRLFIETSQNYSLSVVPLFILMGLFVNKGGLSRELYQVSYAFMGHLRGGLAMATIVACAGFSAICGSSLATAATMSKVAMPQMRKYGYDDSLSTASIAAGGTLGILIPPSVILLIYGFLTNTSPGKLFIAGILPGLLGVLLYLVAVKFTIIMRPESGPAGERTGLRDRFVALRGVWAVLLLFFLVIGGLYGALNEWPLPLGLTFSPTEAAGMGATGAFLIALSRGTLTISNTINVLVETAHTTAGLFAVLIGAHVFSNFVNRAGLPEGLLSLVESTGFGPMAVMMVILLVYLVLGCVFESMSMMLLTVPIFFPLVTSLGFDPIWFGIIVVVVIEISLITPPVGLNVFVLKGVVGDVSTATIFKGVTPFWIVDIIRLALLVLIPSIALYLPGQM